MSIIAELGVRLSADYARFNADLDRANQGARGAFAGISAAAVAMGAAVALAGVAAAKELFELGKNTLELGDKLANLKARTGVGVEALSGLKFAAEQSDSSLEGLQKGLLKLNQSIGAALRDDAGKAAQAFRALGIDIQESAKGGTEKVFNDIADAVKRTGDATALAGPGTALLGKGFIELTPLLQAGSEGLAEFNVQAKNLGQILTEETAQASADFNDNVDVLKAGVQGFANALAAELLPAMAAYSKTLADGASAGTGAAETAEVFGDVIKGVALAFVALKNAVEGLVNIYAGYADVQQKLLELDFAGAQAAAQVALEGVAGAALDVETAYKAAFDAGEDLTKNARLLAAFDAGIAADDAKERTAQIQAQVAAEKARTAAIQAGKAALAERTAALERDLDAAARSVQKFQDADAANNAAAIATLDRLTAKYEPLKAAALAYAAALKQISLSSLSSADQARALALLTREYEAQKRAIEAQLNPLREKLRSIDEEIEANGRLAKAKAESQAAYNAQLLIENEQKRIGRELTEKEIRLIKERSAALDASRDAVGSAGGIKTLREAWEAATRAGIEGGANAADLGAFFAKLKQGVAEAFSDAPLQATADAATGLAGIVESARAGNAGGGNAVGSAARAVNTALANAKIPVISQIAQIVSAIDRIAGGRIFGTSNTQTASGQSASFSQTGFAGQTTAFFERQRALFGGIARSQTVTAADQEAAAQLTAFFNSIRNSVALGARALSVQVPQLITGAFAEVKDKDGKITRQVSEVAGRIFTEGFADFQRRIQAENIIAVVQASASEAGAIAEQWRSNAELLSQGAKFFLVSQADFVNGIKILGDSQNLGGLTKIIQELADPGEELADAYNRIKNSTLFLRDVLANVGVTTDKTSEQFVRFSAALVQSLGGLQNASTVISRVLSEFFDPSERAAATLASANARALAARDAAETALGFDIDPSRIQKLIADALAGVFSPEVATAVLLYADAQADVNALQRDATAALKEREEQERASLAALAAAISALSDFNQSLSSQINDIGLTDYQRQLVSINEQFKRNTAEVLRLSEAAGDGADKIRGLGLASQLMAAQTAQAVRALSSSVLNDLLALYEDTAPPVRDLSYQNILTPVINGTALWRAELEKVERQLKASGLAQNLRDLFKANGETFADGIARLQVPIKSILKDLGVSIGNVTNPAALSAFGAAARALGISAEELAKISGLDLSTLTPEQRALITEAQNRQTLDEQNSAYLKALAEGATADQEAKREAEKQDREEAKATLQVQQEIARILAAQTLSIADLSDALLRGGQRAAVGV